ncbi:MAG: gliding motility-associated C-terminal domain-containing protein [Flavobacteriales bacterium]
MAEAANAQLWCTSYLAKEETNYVGLSDQDTVYFICGGGTSTLTALPESGTGPWTFVWSEFYATGNTWQGLTSDIDVISSTQSGLVGNGYRLIIYDANDVNVGQYIAWISEVSEPVSVDVSDIPPGCTDLDLIGNIDWGTATPVYNPPPDGLIITPSTEITVCFTGTTSYVSDLGFYLNGPCGEDASVALFPPEFTACNNGNNFTNFCFTTEPADNFTMCTAPTPLTGTYSSFSVVNPQPDGISGSNVPIDWSPLYGCDASAPGWCYLVVDCAFGDFSAVTDVSITFVESGNTVQITTPSNWNDPLDDGFCLFVVNCVIFDESPPIVAPFDQSFQWLANPIFAIPGATTDLSINMNVPLVDTDFTLTVSGSAYYTLCGGDINDTETFEFEAEVEPEITSEVDAICENGGVIYLEATPAGGVWSGGGIIDTLNGIFQPNGQGDANVQVTYTISDPCTAIDVIIIDVNDFEQATITNPGQICELANPFNLTANPAGGTWNGEGITNTTAGTFDAGQVVDGLATVNYVSPGQCPSSTSIDIEVTDAEDPTISGTASMCEGSPTVTYTTDIMGGTWSPANIINVNGQFTPSNDGTFTITYTTAGACAGTDSFDITVNPTPAVNLTPASASICAGETVSLQASGASTYSWAGGTSPTTGANVSATPATTTVITVTGTSAAPALCSATDNITITVHPLPIANIANVPSICQGEDVQLVATPAGLEYSWTPAGSLSDNDIANPFASPNTTTTYTVTVTDQFDCTDTDDVTVTVIEGDPSFTVTDNQGNPSDNEGIVPLFVTFTPNGTASEYVWNFGNGTGATLDANDPDPTAEYDIMDYYTVTLTITVNGCEFTSSQEIFAYEDSRLAKVPNVITPNSDGLNDNYTIDARNMETLEMHIFNRWGAEVGTINKPDGFWAPGNLSEGTYYYVLKAKGFDNKVYEHEGTITILRK